MLIGTKQRIDVARKKLESKINVDEVNQALSELAERFKADGIKVYFQDKEHYSFKIIKNDAVITTIRKRRNTFDNKK